MALGSVAYPRQTVCVTCRGRVKAKFSPDMEVKDNIITLSWHMPVSFDPELYAIAVGKERYSLKLIKESDVFVVNFMPHKLKDAVLFCGRNSGEYIDKFRETGLKKEEAEKIDCCRIKQAAGCIECETVNQFEAGDHVILVGKVLKTVDKKKAKKLFQIGGNRFTTTR